MVQPRVERDLKQALEITLADRLPSDWRVQLMPSDGTESPGIDATLELVSPSGDRSRACVEFKARAEPGEVVRELPWLQRCGAALLVAPRISSRTRQLLNDAGISWLEPDGDCRIAIGGLFVERLTRSPRRREPAGKDGRFVADPFSGGALRIVRWLLIDPDRSWALTEMAERAGLTPGFVSRTFKTLARDAFVVRTRGATRLTDRDGLLDAWARAPAPADSAFERVATVDGPEALLRTIRASAAPRPYAVTAEAAADRIVPFARFSRVEIYVKDPDAWDRALGLTPVPRGGNLVLIEPADPGVFDGSFEQEGLLLTSRPQLYVDLVRRGGAAGEAASFLRERNALWPR